MVTARALVMAFAPTCCLAFAPPPVRRRRAQATASQMIGGQLESLQIWFASSSSLLKETVLNFVAGSRQTPVLTHRTRGRGYCTSVLQLYNFCFAEFVNCHHVQVVILVVGN